MSAGFTSVELNGNANLYVIARQMIANGFEPDELIEWVRDGIPVFDRPYPLSYWIGDAPFRETAA